MLTMTMLPERMLDRVHYLAHNRRRVLFTFIFHKSSPGGVPTNWPKYKAPNWKYLELNADKIKIKKNMAFVDRCKYWNNVLPGVLEALEECQDDNGYKIPTCPPSFRSTSSTLP